jgi:hypothetical protein
LAASGFERIDVRPATPFITTTWSLQALLFGRVLSTSGLTLLAGYAISVPVSAISRVLDGALGGGDFLHAFARRPVR